MSYYKVCPHCGCHLDSGERCDCMEKTIEEKSNKNLMEVHIMPKNNNANNVYMELVSEIMNSSPAKLREMAVHPKLIEIFGEDKAKEFAAILENIAKGKEKAAASDANTDNGVMEIGLPTISATMIA